MSFVNIQSSEAWIKILTISLVSDDETNAINDLIIIFEIVEGNFDILSFKLIFISYIGKCDEEALKVIFDDSFESGSLFLV